MARTLNGMRHALIALMLSANRPKESADMPHMDSLRILLIDLENAIGAVNPRPHVVRARISALREAAGTVHHAVAGYSTPDLTNDPVASILAELGVASLRVAPAPNAAEKALLAHARRIHDALGCRTFLVASADRRFAELTELGRVELLAWHDQPIAGKLERVAQHVHRLTCPIHTPNSSTRTSATNPPTPAPCPTTRANRVGRDLPLRSVVTALATGIGVGVGVGVGLRLIDMALRPRRQRAI